MSCRKCNLIEDEIGRRVAIDDDGPSEFAHEDDHTWYMGRPICLLGQTVNEAADNVYRIYERVVTGQDV